MFLAPLILILTLIATLVPAQANARTWQAGDFSFSDELGGFRLVSVTGDGSIEAPIILVEEVTGPGPAILLVRNLRLGPDSSNLGGQQEAGAFVGLAMIKIVTNRGKYRWSGFEMELREDAHQPSVYSDGLSFDQIATIRQDLYSDRFAQAKQSNEPYDRLVFDRGRLKPSETAVFHFNIVDLSPRSHFYLVQEPIMLLSDKAAPPANRQTAENSGPLSKAPNAPQRPH